VRSGTIDIALGLRGAEGDAFPRTSIIELPFLVRDATTGSRALWTLFQKGAFGPEFSEFKVLALFVQNPGLLHTARKPVTVVDDIKGLRLRAPNQAAAAALTQVGALPVILQVNDVMPAVQSGQIEGIVTNWGNPLPGFNAAMHSRICRPTSSRRSTRSRGSCWSIASASSGANGMRRFATARPGRGRW
jgi:TRAP-type C4-dicarboxylate transport system substrate-binding protein